MKDKGWTYKDFKISKKDMQPLYRKEVHKLDRLLRTIRKNLIALNSVMHEQLNKPERLYNVEWKDKKYKFHTATTQEEFEELKSHREEFIVATMQEALSFLASNLQGDFRVPWYLYYEFYRGNPIEYYQMEKVEVEVEGASDESIRRQVGLDPVNNYHHANEAGRVFNPINEVTGEKIIDPSLNEFIKEA